MSDPLEGPRWPSTVVTYSFAAMNHVGQPALFSAFITNPIYQAIVENAAAAWSAVSGIQFQLVPDSSSVDIRVGVEKLGLAPGGAWNKTQQQRMQPPHAALFTEDAVRVTPGGLISGRAEIERRFAETVKHFETDPIKLEQVKMIGAEVMLLARSWSGTYDGKYEKGYWSEVYVRDGNTWKIKQETAVVTPTRSWPAPPGRSGFETCHPIRAAGMSRITGPLRSFSGAGVTIRLAISGCFRFFLGARFSR